MGPNRPESDLQDDWLRWVAAGRPDHPFLSKGGVKKMLDANPPIYFERNMRLICVTAREYLNADVVLASFAYSPEFPQHAWSSDTAFRHTYGEANGIIRTVAEDCGAYFFDFAAAFPPEKDLYHDGIHLNVNGLTIKATLFADFIQDHLGEKLPRLRPAEEKN